MNQLIWLRLNEPSFAPPDPREPGLFRLVNAEQVYEYKAKKVFATATLSLKLCPQGNHSSAAAELSAKIPFKAAYHFKANSLSSHRSPVSFANFEFQDRSASDSAETTKNWSSDDGSLIYYTKSGHSKKAIADCSSLDFTEVLSPLFLIPALGQSWRGPEFDYAASFLAGNQVSLLLLEPLLVASDETNGKKSNASFNYEAGTETVRLQVTSLNVPIEKIPREEAEFRALPWNSGVHLSVEFNTRKRALQAAEFTFPVLGKIRLELTQFRSRELAVEPLSR